MGEGDLQERDAFLGEAEALLDKCDCEAALALAEARLERMSGDLDARSVICRVWIQQGRIDEARDMIGEMEAILASFSRVYACMGDAFLKKGMQESAQYYYRKYAGLKPDAPLSLETAERLKGISPLPEQESESDAEDAGQVPSDFQTVTLAELYIRQGHLRPAAEVLEAIIRKEPQNEKAATLLREVWEMILREESRQRYAGVIGELSRWLDNIGRSRGHAA
jgi:tetratricopeptide (TPR) repeat protein